MFNVDDGSSEFDEVIYSQETPKHQGIYKDFNWDEDKFVEYLTDCLFNSRIIEFIGLCFLSNIIVRLK